MSADLHLPHQLAGANQTLTAQCHCKSVHFTIAVPTSALPLPAYLCHCHICRYIHGTLCIFHAPLPKEVEPEFISPSSLENSLTGYIHNEGAVSERLFCTTCGCHIGDRLHPDPETGRSSWVIAASIFTPQNENTFQIHAHYFTTSAPGDGFYSWLPSIQTLEYSHPAKDDRKDAVPSSPECLPQTDDQGNEVLLAQCHCAGVRFTLPRPSEEEQNDPFFSRFLSRVDPSKRVACVCVCKDCRLVDGTHAVGWTFAPLASLQPAINADFNNHGTLKAYRSSDKVTRAFCGKCGATVFYTIDDEERAPTEDKRIVDIAVGLFRAPEGILAENWLTWRTGRLAGAQSGLEYDKAFTEALGKGLKEWGSQKYGEATNFNIPHDG